MFQYFQYKIEKKILSINENQKKIATYEIKLTSISDNMKNLSNMENEISNYSQQLETINSKILKLDISIREAKDIQLFLKEHFQPKLSIA